MANTSDADLILKLYELRRETEMRKARDFIILHFMPESADDVMKYLNAFGTQENAWLRQVAGYWDMAAALVLHDRIDVQLFTDTNAEMWGFFAKFSPFVKELREKSGVPHLLVRVEKVASATQDGRERLAMMEKRWAARRQEAKSQKSGH